MCSTWLTLSKNRLQSSAPANRKLVIVFAIENLISSLVLAFDTNGVFRRHLPKGEPLDRCPFAVRRHAGRTLTDALEQPNDEGQAGRLGDEGCRAGMTSPSSSFAPM